MKAPRRRLIWLVLGAIAGSAALGVYGLVLPGEWGDVQWKVLGTSASVTGGGILVLACLPAWERGRLGLIPPAGAAASVLAFAMLVGGIWGEPDVEPFWKTMGTLLWIGAWAALSSLLALAQLAPRYRWTFTAAVALGLLLAALGISWIWSEADSEVFGRVIGVVSVLVAAFTLAIPLLHRASRQEVAASDGKGSGSVAFCPRCGRSVSGREGEDVACPECRARFRVRFLTR